MPTVPYSPVPSVAASASATPGVQVSTPIEAFGGGIASAVGSVGRTVEHAGDEMFKRAIALQELENDSLAKEADAKYIIQAGQKHAAFNALEGRAAVQAFPRYMRDLQILRRQFSDAMPNDSARKMFDSASRQTMSRTIFNGAGHAATENKRWAIGASNARVTAAVSDALHNPNDPNTINRGLATIQHEAGFQEAAHGWSGEQREVWEQQQTSKLVLERIRGLAPKDPVAAKRFFEENRERILGQDLDNAERLIDTNLYRVESLRIANEVVERVPEEGQPGISRRDAIEQARKIARERVPNNPEFESFTADRVGAAISKRDAVIREDRAIRNNTVEGALVGRYGDGTIPTSPEQLMALDPAVEEAWQKLDPRDQRRYMSVLAQNARGDHAWTEDGLRRYQELKGMAGADATKYLGLDLTSEKLPWSARKELINLQQRLRQNPESNPNITRALQTLAPMMQSAGVLRNQNEQRYFQFRGALADALQTFQQVNNRQPRTTEEFYQIGSNLLQEQRQPGRLFGQWWQRSTPLFEIDVPETEMDRFRNDPRWGGQTPSEAEIARFRQMYIRDQYKKLFGSPVAPSVPMSR